MYRSPLFCFPWRRPCDYHAICCMDGKTIQCFPNPRSMYLSIFNSFRVIRCLSQCVSPKIAIFTHLCLPWGRPWGNHAKRCMNEKTIQCLPNPRSMYVSIFNTFRVIRYLIQCVSPKIAIFTTFWFILGTPLGQSR